MAQQSVNVAVAYLNSGSMDGYGTGGILAFQSTVNDDDIWTALLLECKSEAKTGRPCADEEDLGKMRQGHWRVGGTWAGSRWTS